MDSDSITISIRTVDDSGPVLQQVETRILGVGTAASSTTQMMKGLGTAGVVTAAEFDALRGAIAANTAALEAFHGAVPRATHELGAMHGNMRLVSGTAREFGLNLGYSMRSFLAESPAAIGAIHAMEIGFLAMAAVDIGVQVIEGVQHLYEKWFDVTKAVDDYEKKAAEAAKVQLFDTASIETTISLLGQVGAQVDELTKKKEEAGVDKPLGGLAQWLRAPARTPGDLGSGWREPNLLFSRRKMIRRWHRQMRSRPGGRSISTRRSMRGTCRASRTRSSSPRLGLGRGARLRPHSMPLTRRRLRPLATQSSTSRILLPSRRSTMTFRSRAETAPTKYSQFLK